MKNESKISKYYIVFGNRRLAACKKLGWKTITAKIMDTEDTKAIKISDISHLKNVRIRIEDGDIAELMRDIKDRGLLQPIGVVLVEKGDVILDEKFITTNLAENIHRKDVTPLEEGQMYDILHEFHGLSYAEIAARCNIPVHRVKTIMKLVRTLPEDVMKEIVNKNKNRTKAGISLAVASNIAPLRISKAEMQQIFDAIRKLGLNQAQSALLAKAIAKGGMPIEDAIENIENTVIKTICLVLKKDEADKLSNFTKIIRALAQKTYPSLFY